MKYVFSAGVSISLSTTVFAKTEEEAFRIAKSRPPGSVYPSHDEAHKDEWIAEELDGAITGIKLERVSEGDGDGEDEEDEW